MERICNQLEELLSDIVFCGISNISSEVYQRLLLISSNMKDIGMETGSIMVNRLNEMIAGYRRNENDGNEAAALISSLEFYLKNIMK